MIAGFRVQFRPGGCAQLCNDASTSYYDGDPSYMKKINVEHKCINGTLVFVAKKRIKKGEELLHSYGSQYWAMKRERESGGTRTAKDHFTILMGLILHECHPSVQEALPELHDELLREYDTTGDTEDDYRKRFVVLSTLTTMSNMSITT